MNTNYFLFQRRSAPYGFQEFDQIVTNGTVVSLPELYGADSGYHFGYWEVNGQRIEDVFGRAVGGVDLVVTGTTVAVAYYFSSNEDVDADGIPDWYEWHEWYE